jgi:hypothetical protein
MFFSVQRTIDNEDGITSGSPQNFLAKAQRAITTAGEVRGRVQAGTSDFLSQHRLFGCVAVFID